MSCYWGCAELITRTDEQFAGHDCVKLENGSLSLWAMRSASLRVIGLAMKGEANLFAELPGMTVAWPNVGTYTLYGGHRLWISPEDPRRTYLPDDDPPAVTQIEDGLLLTQPPAERLPIEKSLAITLHKTAARVTIEHTLRNVGSTQIELAPWAITQLRPGGVAILPLAAPPTDAHGLLSNRKLVLWPYTRFDSPLLTWSESCLSVEAQMRDGAFKIGFPNPSGWIAYAVDDTLFVKQSAYRHEAGYPDQGCSSECYCCPRFLELETLGPFTLLAPGREVSHRETWSLGRGRSYGDVLGLIGEAPA